MSHAPPIANCSVIRPSTSRPSEFFYPQAQSHLKQLLCEAAGSHIESISRLSVECASNLATRALTQWSLRHLEERGISAPESVVAESIQALIEKAKRTQLLKDGGLLDPSLTPPARDSVAPLSSSIRIPPALLTEIMVRRRADVVNLCEDTGVMLHVNDEGFATITGTEPEKLNAAMRSFTTLVVQAQRAVDEVVAVVIEVIEFLGVRVSFNSNCIASVHASRISPELLQEGLEVGDQVRIRLLGCDVTGILRADLVSRHVTTSQRA